MKALFVLLRWLAAIALWAVAYWMASKAIPAETLTEGAPEVPADRFLTAMGLLLVGAILIAPELIHWITYPFHRFFNNVFFPGENAIPPPDYNVTRVYREQERFEEAIEQYFTILHNHPQELLAYIEGIETAFESGDEASALKLLHLAQRKLETPVARDEVERVYGVAQEAARQAAQEQEEDGEDEGSVDGETATTQQAVPAGEGEEEAPKTFYPSYQDERTGSIFDEPDLPTPPRPQGPQPPPSS